MEAKWSLHAVSSLAFVIITMASVVTGCGQIQFSEVSGFLSSINYPNVYPDNLNCTYSIHSSPRSIGSVFIGFTDIETETTYDKIEIWCSTDSNNRRRFTGQYTSLPSFTLHCYEVKVNFKTDGSVTKRGFKLFFYWISTERETTAPKTTAPSTTAPTTTAPTTTAPTTTAPTTTAQMTTAQMTTAQTTVESSDISYGFLNAVLDKTFAVLGSRTSVLLNLAFGCLLCVSLIAIFVAICRRRRRNFNKMTTAEEEEEEEEEERRQRSNGHYSLDPMRKKGKHQKSVESFNQQQQQQQRGDNVSENDYANYDADGAAAAAAAAVDDDEVYECIDDFRD